MSVRSNSTASVDSDDANAPLLKVCRVALATLAAAHSVLKKYRSEMFLAKKFPLKLFVSSRGPDSSILFPRVRTAAFYSPPHTRT